MAGISFATNDEDEDENPPQHPAADIPFESI